MSLRAALSVALLSGLVSVLPAAEPIRIGSRREIFVDDYLVERFDGKAHLRLHAPMPREIVLSMDRPWEGVYSGYATVLEDRGKYRMYYRGLPEAQHTLDSEVTCCAESTDGIRWTKPDLGLFEVRGTRQNNVVLARHRACHNFAPMLDANPAAPPEQRYKALGGTGAPGLIAFVSADGVRWKELQKEPVITQGAFDSQNVAFWSTAEGCYVCYFRVFRDGVRWIARATSKDFLHWSEPVDMDLDAKPREHLYTNQTFPYPRAPHVYLGLPTRFLPGRRALSDETLRKLGTPKDWDYANDCAEVLFTSTRGGSHLSRTFLEAFIRPGLDPRDWTSRASYAAHGILMTGPEEMSIYVQHHCGYPSSHVRRYTLRPDGFASAGAPFSGGDLLTRPLVFEGRRLVVNFASSAAGSLRVELQDASGKPIPGLTLADCPELFGNELARTVAWRAGPDVGRLSGQPVRLRFAFRDADLFSLQFRP